MREDRAAKALTLTHGSTTVVLSLDQGLASIGGRLISLSSPPVRDGSRWLLAPDVVARAVSLAADTRVEVRRASRLVVVGDARVPRLTIRQEAAGAATRVVVDMAPRTSYTVTQEARRLAVKFDADGLDASGTGGPQGLVESVATSEPATLVIHLMPGFASFRSAAVPVDAATARLVIDLLPAGGGAPPAPSPSAPKAAEPAPSPPPADLPALGQSQAPALRTIVIDPGHGGDEAGARGASGLLEKDVTLDVARRLKASLEGRLGIRVLLTRDDDRLVPLDERASIANNNKADLFISLHANASPRPDARGAEVFYLSLDGYSEAARTLAQSPPATPLPALGGASRSIELIAWDMAQAQPPRGVGGVHRLDRRRAAPARRHEPACDPAGPVAGAGLRQHAGGARRDGVPQQRSAGSGAGPRRVQEPGCAVALRRDRAVPGTDRDAAVEAAPVGP